MKLLVNKENVVILSLANDVVLNVTSDHVNFKLIDKGPEGDLNIERNHVISQLNSLTASVIENVTAVLPEDFSAGKYKFVNNDFVVIDGWRDPVLPK